MGVLRRGYYNFTKFHENPMKNKKVLCITNSIDVLSAKESGEFGPKLSPEFVRYSLKYQFFLPPH